MVDIEGLTKHGRPMMPNGVNNALYNVVKYYNEYELKRHQKRKESQFLFINSLLML